MKFEWFSLWNTSRVHAEIPPAPRPQLARAHHQRRRRPPPLASSSSVRMLASRAAARRCPCFAPAPRPRAAQTRRAPAARFGRRASRRIDRHAPKTKTVTGAAIFPITLPVGRRGGAEVHGRGRRCTEGIRTPPLFFLIALGFVPAVVINDRASRPPTDAGGRSCVRFRFRMERDKGTTSAASRISSRYCGMASWPTARCASPCAQAPSIS